LFKIILQSPTVLYFTDFTIEDAIICKEA